MTGKLIRTLSYSGTTASRQVVIADPSVAVIAALDAVIAVRGLKAVILVTSDEA